MNGDVFDFMDAELDMKWGAEYSNLCTAHQMLIIEDYSQCSRKDRDDYRSNIGIGNLESYVKVLAAQLSR